MTSRFLLLAAVASVTAAPVLAGNLEPVTVAPVAVPVAVAPAPIYDWTGFYAGLAAGYIDAETTDDSDLDGDGAFGGLRLGYDTEFGSVLVGGRLDYDVTDVDLGDGNDLDDITRLGLRVGFDSGRNLYYGIGGYANADTNTVGDSDGYFVGAGYEVFLTQSLTLGAEALYHEFDDFDGDVEGEATTVGLSLNFRF